MSKKVLITGITGQDGSYLAEFLLAKGYEVHGLVRRVAIEDQKMRLGRISHLADKMTLHSASLTNYGSVFSVVNEVKPDECYHLGANSFVTYSFEDAFDVFDININGTLYILSALQKIVPQCKFYFAGSSEMFGDIGECPQNETTKFHPRSPYGISKVTGFHTTRNFREGYKMFSVTGMLFNHESPRRGFEFVTRKITDAVARIKAGELDKLHLGNLEAQRDWGYTPEYIEAMWLMLQQDKPDDYVIATGETHSVKQFAEEAFSLAGLNWQDHIVQDEKLIRPAEVHKLMGDITKAKQELSWEPKVKFKELVKIMVEADLKRFNLNI